MLSACCTTETSQQWLTRGRTCCTGPWGSQLTCIACPLVPCTHLAKVLLRLMTCFLVLRRARFTGTQPHTTTRLPPLPAASAMLATCWPQLRRLGAISTT